MRAILKKTRSTLGLCKKCTELFDNNQENEEMKQALLDVFTALIRFWAEASKHMREMNSGMSTRFLISYHEMSEKASTRMRGIRCAKK